MKTTSWKAALLASAVSAGLAGVANAQAADPETSAVEDVVVTGRRVSTAAVAIGTDQTTNTIAITREALLSAPGGISGLKMLESLPGFNVQANDALGLYEFGNSVTVRAFNFQQIGFVLDGVPMGRSDQFGGSPIFRYVENENLASVTASQGAGDVTLPSYASLGPIVRYDTIDPAEEFGVFTGLSVGSDNLRRAFVRVDSGEHDGWSGYASFSDFSADLWRGPGDINREHAEGKLRYQGPNGLEATLGVTWNDYFDFDAPRYCARLIAGAAGDVFGRRGRGFGYLDNVPTPGPVGSAATPNSLPATVAGVPFSNTAYNQYFKQAINSRTDTLIHANLSAPLRDNLRVEAVAYYEDKDGYGVSPEAYATSLSSYNNQRPFVSGLTAPRGLQYGLSTVEGERSGLVGRAVWELGAHTITGGFWVETDDYRRTQARYNQVDGSPDGAPLLNEPVHLQRDYVSTRETRQLFLQDVISLLDGRLKLELGVKALDIDYEISGFRNPADYNNRRRPRITDSWKDRLLPNVGLVWEITDTDQVFAGFSENLALPRGADDIFSLASPAAPGPEAETSENIEVGIRTNRPTFNAALAIYRTRFDNRLQSFASVVPGSTTTETFFQNVGTVEAYGGEFSGVWKPSLFNDQIYFNTNVSYNISEFKDNFTGFNIAGNRTPDSPEWVIQGGVTVEPLPWLVGNVSVRRISERFTNFTNTETTNAYTVINAYIDFGRDWNFGPVRDVSIRLNVDNLTDEDYLGTINTTTGASDFPTVIRTTSTFRPGPRRTVQISLTSSF
jgi:iron complex outermembrane recepter protein